MQPCVKSVQNYLTLKQNRKPLILSICLGILDNVLKSHIRSQNYEDFVILENILEIDAANKQVIIPTYVIKLNVNSDNSNIGEHLATRKTPAVTIVAA